jgi:hypothetical protein
MTASTALLAFLLDHRHALPTHPLAQVSVLAVSVLAVSVLAVLAVLAA